LKYKIDLYLKDVHARNLYVQLMSRHNAVTSFFRTCNWITTLFISP